MSEAQAVTPMNRDGEPLHTGDDERIDCVTGILAALDELSDAIVATDEISECICSARQECERLDALLIETIKRERAAARVVHS